VADEGDRTQDRQVLTVKPEVNEAMKEFVKRIPILGDMARRVYRRLLAPTPSPEPFPGTAEYWEKRYSNGGNSGAGSYDFFAEFKADVINRFVASHPVQTVIEFGCGDGNQLRQANYPTYVGFDISKTVISKCRELFQTDPHKSFRLMSEFASDRADLALSLDVIYHLVEDEIFSDYMQTLFRAADRYVIIYASDTDDNRGFEGTHVKHRRFTKWIQANLPNWQLIEHLPNRYPYHGDHRKGSFAEFFMYEKV
jgi:hypothetical protein